MSLQRRQIAKTSQHDNNLHHDRLVEAKLKRKIFSERDKSNLNWFWQNYMRARTKWLALVFLLIIFQGFVYQQFLVLTLSLIHI